MTFILAAIKKKITITEDSKDKLSDQTTFLEKHNIDVKDFQKTKIKWSDLKVIFEDYVKITDSLERAGKIIIDILFSNEARENGIHSVRYRIKSPKGLIEKIIKKKIREPKSNNITVKNYREEITDLIGVRALHVFKQEWHIIDSFIKRKWNFKVGHEKVVVYCRDGDHKDYIDECENRGCTVKKHSKGYRSVHYIVKQEVNKEEIHCAEIQVRTIFEEGWSEIDHRIRYSLKNQSKHPLEEHLLILNGIAGSADEFGKLIKRTHTDIEKGLYGNQPTKAEKNIKKKGGGDA